MAIGRWIGWCLALAGLAVLGRDALLWLDLGRLRPMALGELWFDVAPTSLQLLQPAVQRYLHPALWDDVIQPLLLLPAFAMLISVGVLLALLLRRRGEPRMGRHRRFS